MYCAKCGTENKDDAVFCSKCGFSIKEQTGIASNLNKKGVQEQLDRISEEIEKLEGIYKLGFYMQGFFLWFLFSVYTLFIGPIIVYFSGKRGWPKNSLIKAVLYYNVYVLLIILIAVGFFVIIGAIGAFVFMGSS